MLIPGSPSLPGAPGLHRRLQALNDSKATNYDAAAAGPRAIQGSVVVLAGGSTKQGDASDWLAELNRKACAVVLFGLAPRNCRG